MFKSQKNVVLVIIFIAIVAGALFYQKKKSQNTVSTTSVDQSSESIKKTFESQKLSTTSPTEPVQKFKQTLELNQYTFERNIFDCFQGEPCKFSENPFQMYETFKKEGKRKEMDSLISFLRKELQNPSLRDSYKDPLKKMINDFYPPEQIYFQMAAYYSYLGDLEKSRTLYLDLIKKSKDNPKIFAPSKLNIANVCYDLKRYKEARKYYQEALKQFTSGEFKLADGESNTIDFINERLKKLESI